MGALEKTGKILRRRSVQLMPIVLLVVLLVSTIYAEFPNFDMTIFSGGNALNTGIIIPLFTQNFSLSQVNDVIIAKQANPQVPFIVERRPFLFHAECVPI